MHWEKSISSFEERPQHSTGLENSRVAAPARFPNGDCWRGPVEPGEEETGRGKGHLGGST